MRRHLIRLAVALVTFVLGLKLAWAFGLLFGPAVNPSEVRPVYVAPPAFKVHACPHLATPAIADVPEPPPPPPAPKPTKRTRVVIKQADGTVQIIESQKESRDNF